MQAGPPTLPPTAGGMTVLPVLAVSGGAANGGGAVVGRPPPPSLAGERRRKTLQDLQRRGSRESSIAVVFAESFCGSSETSFAISTSFPVPASQPPSARVAPQTKEPVTVASRYPSFPVGRSPWRSAFFLPSPTPNSFHSSWLDRSCADQLVWTS